MLGSKTPYELSVPICRIKNIDLNKQITLDEKIYPNLHRYTVKKFFHSIALYDEFSFATKQHQESYTGLLGGIDQAKNRL